MAPSTPFLTRRNFLFPEFRGLWCGKRKPKLDGNSDVAGPAQALKPSRAGPGLGQAEPSLTQGLGGLKARASEMPGPPGLESPGLDIYGQERADGAKRSRHFGLGGFGSVKCRTLWCKPVVRLIVAALNCNLLTHRIAVVSNVQNNRKTPNFVVGILFFIFVYEKAWAQARAQGFRPCTQGSVSGLKNLRPEPAQAEPKPGHSGRAGPATSLDGNGGEARTRRCSAETDAGSSESTQEVRPGRGVPDGVSSGQATRGLTPYQFPNFSPKFLISNRNSTVGTQKAVEFVNTVNVHTRGIGSDVIDLFAEKNCFHLGLIVQPREKFIEDPKAAKEPGENLTTKRRGCCISSYTYCRSAP
ncbi:hypothetical protein B0H16DRAFT_1459396 [Mycena metata]|uniref:Uncharacterized protein n=1 Tax=Mycena metata TaxID=1033252 RepID=A0AAD7J1Z9_9AGAR|nr:hypothetical protein B0H16DRAFT_1459396 [Mycena metata]